MPIVGNARIVSGTGQIYYTASSNSNTVAADIQTSLRTLGIETITIIQGAPGANVPFYDLIGYWRGQLPSDAIAIHYFKIARAIKLPSSLIGSAATCLIAPTADVTLNLIKIHANTSVIIGTMNFAAGLTTGTFTFPDTITFAPGDIWEVDPPSIQDTTFASLSWTITATVV